MLISIITVCRDAEDAIERCIKSVKGQQCDNLEYIIIDGASTDGTLDIIREYDNVITKWISEPDDGIYDAMNKGIDMSSGDWITFINSDDELGHDAVGKVLPIIEEDNTDVIFGDILYVDGETQTRNRYETVDLNGFYYEMSIAHPGTFVRGDLYRKYKFDTEYRLAADYDFFRRIYIDGYRFRCIPEVLAVFRAGGATSRDAYSSLVETCQIAREGLGEDSVLREKYLPIIENREYLASFFRDRQKIIDDKMFCARFVKDYISERTVIIFGAGHDGGELLSLCTSMNLHVDAFVDSNHERWNTRFDNVIIREPQYVKGEKNVIIIAASRLYYRQMIEMMTKIVDVSATIISMSDFMSLIARAYNKCL